MPRRLVKEGVKGDEGYKRRGYEALILTRERQEGPTCANKNSVPLRGGEGVWGKRTEEKETVVFHRLGANRGD